MIRRNITDSPTSRGQQGVPELIRGLTDLCESAPFLHPRKRQQQQQKRRSLRRFSWRRYGKSEEKKKNERRTQSWFHVLI